MLPYNKWTTMAAFAALLLVCSNSFSQSDKSFSFLDVAVSARVNALGGVNVSIADKDNNFFFGNPSLVSDSLSGAASVSLQRMFGGVTHGGITYSKNFRSLGMMTFGVQYLNYGTIQGYDPSGNETNTFRPNETALFVGRSHQIGNYRLGATVKAIFSNLAGYNAAAIAADIGGVFVHPAEDLTIGLTFRNIGVVLHDFSETSDSALPFDVQVGATYRPEHMPLRFSVTAYNLTQSDLPYDDPLDDTDDPTVLHKILGHLAFGTEIFIHRNVNLLAGYNYLRHRELKLPEGGGGAGITLGLSARIKTLDLVLSRASYMAGSAAYSFTLSTDIDRYFKKK